MPAWNAEEAVREDEAREDEYEDALDSALVRLADNTTAADQIQLSHIFAHLQANQAAEQADPQWAGPSLPHPTEATGEAEADELREGWDNWQHGIDPNQIHEGHYDGEALEA
jgi:hypothetical protein